MVIEDQLPDSLKRLAFHPGIGFYAWKKTNLEKLFDEFLKSNVAVKGVEVIEVEDKQSFFSSMDSAISSGKISHTIPLRTGEIKLFEHEIELEKGEDGFDFVDRSNKEMMETINGWDLEKQARPDLRNKIWYHFKLEG